MRHASWAFLVCLLVAPSALAQTINYRSVGTDSGTLASGADASVAAATTVVTVGGPLPADIGQGDQILIDAEIRFILSRDSDTQLTLQTPVGVNHLPGSYTITRAYNTLVAWEADRQGLLTTDDRREVGVVYNDGVLTDTLSISGSTTDATRYMMITVAPGHRHKGTRGSGARLRSAGSPPILVGDHFTRIHWLEIDGGNNMASQQIAFNANFGEAAYLLIYDARFAAIEVQGFDDGNTIRNSFLYNTNWSGIAVASIQIVSTHAGETMTVENVSILNSGGEGIGSRDTGARTIEAHNCIVVGSSGADFGSAAPLSWGTSDYNLSSDASAPGANSLLNRPAAVQFVSATAGAEDLHLSAGSDAIDQGVDLSGSFTDDIDAQTRTGTWDIGADEGAPLAAHPPIAITEASGSYTVTVPGSYELVFEEAAGGGIGQYYDLVEDPTRSTDLVGGGTTVEALFTDALDDGSGFHNTDQNTDGPQMFVLEATATRVKVRQDAFYQFENSTTILPGVKSATDYTVYPTGKVAIDVTRSATSNVAYNTDEKSFIVHAQSFGILSNWSGYSEAGLFGGSYPGTDDFLLWEIDTATVKNDFLAIQHDDWTVADNLGAADSTIIAGMTGAPDEWSLIAWEDAGGTINAGETDRWHYLTYFKPNFVNHLDVNVTRRVTDYRSPDTLSIMVGNPWTDASELSQADNFNEAEGAYVVQFDPALGLRFDISPGASRRYEPVFKIRRWHSLTQPLDTFLGGAPLVFGTDYRADIKPVSRAHFASDLTWHSTFESGPSVATPDIGTSASVAAGVSFVSGRHGNAAEFNTATENITFNNAGDFDVNEGAIEFWYKPAYDYDDGVAHSIFTYTQDASLIRLTKRGANNLRFDVNDGGALSGVNVTSANYSWRAEDWVHFRVTWANVATGTPTSEQLRIFINGKEPPNTGPTMPYAAASITNAGTMTIGADGGFNANAVIDEFRIYSTQDAPFAIAHGGLTANATEYLGTGNRNLQLDLQPLGAAGRGDYLYFGTDSMFRGLNVQLAVDGAGTADLGWEYWDGAQWVDLTSGFNFTDETNDLTGDGTIHWDQPFSWSTYSVNGGPSLFYVRAFIASGSYTTPPTESVIRTDILIFALCVEITSTQTFDMELPPPTAVELTRFEAVPYDGAIELQWETASELDNVGFHVYRANAEGGPYEPITSRPIPGLGSSPHGAGYRFVDDGLENGAVYFYELEDIETSGDRERHGPVVATPSVAETAPPSSVEETSLGSPSRVTYGTPSASELRIVERTPRRLVIELRTEGFYAEPAEDGSVRVSVPGFDELLETGTPMLPVKRTWLDVVSGRGVKVRSVRAFDVEKFSGLRPAESVGLELAADPNGNVHLPSRRTRGAYRRRGVFPKKAARVVREGYQGDTKKAFLELAPIRWNGRRGELMLAKRLVVTLSFRKGPDEARTPPERNVKAQLVTREPGLYAVELRSVGARRGQQIRLSRHGESVPFHVEEKKLHFLSPGARGNPYGDDAVFEVEVGVAGEAMSVEATSAAGDYYWHRLEREEEHFYQAGLVNAEDLWLWELLLAPERKSFTFDTSGLMALDAPSHLEVGLQGASEGHHVVHAYVNGVFVGETRWRGKTVAALDVEIPPGALASAGNELSLESIVEGVDGGRAYSMVMLDRFSVAYPRALPQDTAFLLDVTDERPVWVDGRGVRDGRRYVASSRALAPEVRRMGRAALSGVTGADYVAITPEAFLLETQPLLELRRDQGLSVTAVVLEDIYREFGYGETIPEAIRQFLRHAYASWATKPRYVVLVGDGTYDFKDRFATGTVNHVPPFIVRTSFLWTASDPMFAAVHGDDELPDLAIGRLPASNALELRALIQKILSYEAVDGDARGRGITLIADDADKAGNFEADADELASGVLGELDVNKIFLSQLGAEPTRRAVMDDFADGRAIVSYLGHGGIHLWADENVFNIGDVPELETRVEQPLVFTMNCLNGFFHFPFFDSLAEALVAAEGKGAIAAVAPSGLSLNGPAHELHEELLRQVLGGGHARLGDAVLAAQQAYAATGTYPELLLLYHLLGDPALTLR